MILIAGGIGAGKSVVSRILRLNGFGVYDCDLEAKKLMNSDSVLRERIIEVCGTESFSPEGSLNRPHISNIIYSDLERREHLNAHVHGAVRKDVEEWLRLDPKNKFVESAIGAQSGLARMAEEIWLVEADHDTRVKRVKERNGFENEKIEAIIKAQDHEEELLINSGKPIVLIENGEGSEVLDRILDLL